jgi:hypothetical protein
MYSTGSKFLDPLLTKVRPKLASSIRDQLNPGGGLFLSRHLTLTDFHERLREREIASVLLPPFFNQTELELLISDDDLDRIADLVTKWPGGHSIKLYSVTGGRREHRFEPPNLRPAAHYAVSLFPPHIAEAAIARARYDDRGAAILDPADALLACAYQAAYLQRECWGPDWVASAKCDARLRELAAAANIALDSPITPLTLDASLAERGWRPSRDLLERAAHWMPWIGDTLPVDEQVEEPGVSLFFLRARAVEAGWQQRILECLRDNGFDLLSVVELDEDLVREAEREFRGGNWGRGPYRISGGPPATICVALDLLPIAVDQKHGASFPDSDNCRTIDAKYAARDLVNAGIREADHYNPVHSTDNSAQTWRAVRILIPKQERELRRKAELLRREFASGEVVRDLTKHGRRAKVELIDHQGQPAIRKTFRPSAFQFMQREIDVMERLAPLCREIPRLLERGPNFIVMEYVGGGATPPSKRRKGAPPQPLPLRHVRKLAELITISMANGFDPIDLRADGNVIYTPSGLHLIDFEFWRACQPEPPESSMCLCGIPDDDTGHQPRARMRNRDPYRIGWYPYTLLSVESFLHDPPPIQAVKRTMNLASAYAAWASRAAFSLAKRTLKRAAAKAVAAAVRLAGPRAARFLAAE